jgi:hypothetical protein
MTSLVPLFQFILATDIEGAKKEILQIHMIRREKKYIYFDGWDGFGASTVLNSIANELSSQKMDAPQELRFDKVLYIDCSEWKSRREMQRAIAEELKLDHGTMAMFDNQDEEDDYNGPWNNGGVLGISKNRSATTICKIRSSNIT